MPREIRIAHSAHGPANSPMAIADGEGLFAARSLDVRTCEVGNTAACVEELVAGTVDLAAAPGVPVINAAMGGLDIVVVMSCASENLCGVIGARHVRTPEDLRGGVVGTTSVHDQGYVLLHRALREWGIDPQADVRTRELHTRGHEWEAVVAGEIDAFATTIPQPLLARRAGLPVLRDFMEEREPYQLGCVVTTRRFAEQHPDLLREVLAAWLAGYRRFQEDAETAMPYLRARTKVDDPEVLAETYRILQAEFDNYVPRVEPLAAVARDLAAARGTPVDLDVSRLVDPSFLPAG